MTRCQWKRFVLFTAFIIAMTVVSLFCAGLAQAGTYTWDANTGTSGAQDGGGTWNTSGASWWNGSSDLVWPNTGSDTAIFGVGGTAGTVTIGTVAVNTMIFNPTGSASYSLASGQITLSGTNPTIMANVNANVSSLLAGSGGLTKSGTANLIFTGTDTITGLTTVSAGTLQIGNGGFSGTITSGGSTNIGSQGTLLFAATNNQTISNSIGGSGVLTFNGGPTTGFTLTGTNSGFIGTLNISRGSVAASGIGGHFPSNTAAINVASGAVFSLTGGTCNSPITINGNGTQPNFNSALALTLSSPNYAGSITLGSSSVISGGGTISGNISGPYQLGFLANAIIVSGSNSYGSSLIEGGNVTFSGSNSLSSGGLLFINSGTLTTSGNSFSVASLSGTSGQFQNGNASIPTVLTVGTDGTNTTYNGTIIDGSTASMGLTKTGGGVLTLGGANTNTGPTVISTGTLQMGNAAALQNTPVTINSGVLDVHGVNASISSIGGSGTIALSSGSLAIGGNNTSSSFSGSIGGTGLFAKTGAGTVTLGGSNSYSGSTTISNGILLLANPSGSALGSSTLTLNGGELASAAGSGGSTGGAVVAGPGGHTISPGGDGTIGSLGVGNLTINSLTTMRFDIASTSSFDQINDAGTFSFSGGSAASVLVPSGLMPGIYPLIGYSSTSSISTANLSLGLNGGGTVPGNYLLQLTPSALDLITGNGYNNSVLAASTSSVAFNRVMLNFVPSTTVAISLSSGTSQTGFNISTSGSITASASGNGPGAIPPSGSVSIGLPNAIGSYNGAVSVQNLGDDGTGPGSAGAGQGYLQSPISIGVTGTVVANRVVTSTSASFGLIHIGQSVSQAVSLTTTGGDSQYSRVTIANGGVDPNGLTVTGGSNPTFNSPTVADSRVLNGAPNTAGIISGAVTLTTIGEGLANESPINVSVPYSIQVFSGSGRFAGSSGSWASNGNWNDSNGSGVHAAPGTWGYNDTATFDGASAVTAIDLTGVNPTLSALNFSNSSYTLSNGNLTLGGSGTAAVTANSGTQTINMPMTLASDANFAINGGALLLTSTIGGSGGFTKSGLGGLTLPQANTLAASGPISVSQGTLVAPFGISSGGGGISVAAGATLQAGLSVQRAVTGVGTVTATNDLFIGNSKQSGQFNQGGAPGVGGTLNIGGNAVFLVQTDPAILGSQTNIAAGGSLTTLDGAQLGNPSSVDATKVLTASGSAKINSGFVNNGVVNGPTAPGEELLFMQAVTGAGSTTGNVEYAASYRPSNSPNAVSVQNVLFDPTNTLIMELAGTQAGIGYDQLDISGLATLNGTLELTYLDGFEPDLGDSFELFDGATTGNFSQIVLPPLSNGQYWDTSGLATSGIVSVAPEPSSIVLLVTAAVGIVGFRARRRTSGLLK